MKTNTELRGGGAISSSAVVRPRVAWYEKTGIIIGSEYPRHRRAFCLTDNGRTEYVQWHELKALDSTPWPNAKADLPPASDSNNPIGYKLDIRQRMNRSDYLERKRQLDR